MQREQCRSLSLKIDFRLSADLGMLLYRRHHVEKIGAEFGAFSRFSGKGSTYEKKCTVLDTELFE